ncbi:MAG: DUF1127 domain-containing protein [Pseudomonadota bacterium]
MRRALFSSRHGMTCLTPTAAPQSVWSLLKAQFADLGSPKHRRPPLSGLADLDERLLCDIGLTREDVRRALETSDQKQACGKLELARRARSTSDLNVAKLQPSRRT